MKIGIIGGTGVYDSSFLQKSKNKSIQTKYGTINFIHGFRNSNEIYFLERHSNGHKLIPSKVNYKGNITALKQLNVDLIISTAAVGAINNCKVGDFVILNQFIDFTKNRSCTFFDEKDAGVAHVDMTYPYCPEIRKNLINSFKKFTENLKENGTYVCTEGPRFETAAEIKMYKILGGDVVGMTNVPEVVLAREASICYATIAMVTNWATGLSKNSLTNEEVNLNTNKMTGILKKVIVDFIDNVDIKDFKCNCKHSLEELNTLK